MSLIDPQEVLQSLRGHHPDTRYQTSEVQGEKPELLSGQARILDCGHCPQRFTLG
jgi:hypothetical protein